MSKSVLFVINGFGMGNATRCDSLMDIIRDEYEIDVITSDKAHLYFQKSPKVKQLFKQQDLNIKKTHTYGSVAYYTSYIPHFIKRLFNNYFIQKKIIAQKKYDMVFFDSDYSFILHKLSHPRQKNIGINNSFEIIRHFVKKPHELKWSFLLSFLIEALDLMFYLIFCKYIICPCLDQKLAAKSQIGKIQLTPALVRKSLIELRSSVINNKALVMASSSNVESSLKKMIEQNQIGHLNFVYHDFEVDNRQSLTESNYVICNSGQSSVAECLYLKKSAVVVRIEDHAEQYVNSQIAKANGLIAVNPIIEDFQAGFAQLKSADALNNTYSYAQSCESIKKHIRLIEANA